MVMRPSTCKERAIAANSTMYSLASVMSNRLWQARSSQQERRPQVVGFRLGALRLQAATTAQRRQLQHSHRPLHSFMRPFAHSLARSLTYLGRPDGRDRYDAHVVVVPHDLGFFFCAFYCLHYLSRSLCYTSPLLDASATHVVDVPCR